MKDISLQLKLIRLLADGETHSMSECIKILGINHTDITKYIQLVHSWGVDILTTPINSYYLHRPLHLLDKSKIIKNLPDGRLTVLTLTDSTNQYFIKRIGLLKSGDACIAEHQAAGRGKRGCLWISPFGKNIYLSLYWRLKYSPTAAIGISLMIGVVIAGILKRHGANDVRLKWPNDLYLNNRKLAGILIEITGIVGCTSHIVIGTGINLAMNEHDHNRKISYNWISLQEVGIDINRNILVAELVAGLRETMMDFERHGFAPFVSYWQELDYFYNRPVKLLMNNQEIKVIARGINDHGAILIEQKGKIKPYSSSISLRAI